MPRDIIPAQTALIIVDLQNDFLHAEGAYSRGGAYNPEACALPERLVPIARALKAGCGMVAATRFTLWPDQQGAPMISEHLHALRPFLRKGDFAPGSFGQQNVDSLMQYIDVSVDKVAYSGFFNTQLDWILKRAGITDIIVSGIVTNGGVASTVRDAHMRDYHCHVLQDGCAAFTSELHKAALVDMASIAKLNTCQRIIQALT
jgi:ureidoacrylate peracid hydrolase